MWLLHGAAAHYCTMKQACGLGLFPPWLRHTVQGNDIKKKSQN